MILNSNKVINILNVCIVTKSFKLLSIGLHFFSEMFDKNISVNVRFIHIAYLKQQQSASQFTPTIKKLRFKQWKENTEILNRKQAQ